MSDSKDNKQPSTLQSYVDSATGAVQGAISSITGNTQDKAEADSKQQKADTEYEASHATAKGPGFTASSSGAVTKDDPDRTTGSWNQTIGSAKEFAGGLIGSENIKQQGRQQNLEGQQQEAKGQLNDYTTGIGDRAQGAIGGAIAGLTGDKEGQQHYQDMHDRGKTQQRGAERDIQKQTDAKSS